MLPGAVPPPKQDAPAAAPTFDEPRTSACQVGSEGQSGVHSHVCLCACLVLCCARVRGGWLAHEVAAEDVKTLTSVTRDRPKVGTNRRPPTKRTTSRSEDIFETTETAPAAATDPAAAPAPAPAPVPAPVPAPAPSPAKAAAAPVDDVCGPIHASRPCM
jgi:hypothetical protein